VDVIGWVQKNLRCSDAYELRMLVDNVTPVLSVNRECALLGLPRCDALLPVSPARESTLPIMARIDTLYLKDLFSGSQLIVN
jgi:putative transposase